MTSHIVRVGKGTCSVEVEKKGDTTFTATGELQGERIQIVAISERTALCRGGEAVRLRLDPESI
jgi:hypothetical protein